MNKRRLLAITRKEFIQILRDRPTLVIVLVMPVMMMLIFGYAVSTDVDRIPTVVFNQDPGAASRFLLEKFQQSKYFNFTGQAGSYGEIREMIESGAARAALVIPPGYSSNLARGEVATVQLIIDGSDPLVATTALSTGQVIAQSFSAQLVEEKLQKMGLGSRLHLPVEVRPRVWYNPDLESLRFNLPGLVGVILQNITVLLTAFALVRERERGTIEQLIVTPIKPGELILGKLIPYVLIAFLEVGFTLAVAVWWFGVEISGSLWLLLALSLFFNLSPGGPGYRPVYLYPGYQPVAGHADDHGLSPSNHPAFGLYLPAGGHAPGSLCPGVHDSPDLLPQGSSRYYPQGGRVCPSLAGGAVPGYLRGSHSQPGCPALPQKIGLKPGS